MLKQRLLLGEHQRVWAAVPVVSCAARQTVTVEIDGMCCRSYFASGQEKVGALRVKGTLTVRRTARSSDSAAPRWTSPTHARSGTRGYAAEACVCNAAKRGETPSAPQRIRRALQSTIRRNSAAARIGRAVTWSEQKREESIADRRRREYRCAVEEATSSARYGWHQRRSRGPWGVLIAPLSRVSSACSSRSSSHRASSRPGWLAVAMSAEQTAGRIGRKDADSP